MQPYKIKLQNFEGPLDLLLFFVRKDELNIYDIPIARITKSYMEYIQLMQDLNLDVAAEFILMAATLMRIKVRMMLPKDPLQEEEEEMLDPREELSRRLIEYRQFKEASKSLSELDEYWRTVYRRSYFNFDLLPQNPDETVGLRDVSFFDLLAAYKKALTRMPKPIFHSVERLNVTVEEQAQFIMEFFQTRSCYLFSELCIEMGKVEIVVTFLALLDLIRQGAIAVKQASLFDDIWIYKAEEFREDDYGLPEKVDDVNVAALTESEVAPENGETVKDEIVDQPVSHFENDAPVESPVIHDEVHTEIISEPAPSGLIYEDSEKRKNDIESPSENLIQNQAVADRAVEETGVSTADESIETVEVAETPPVVTEDIKTEAVVDEPTSATKTGIESERHVMADTENKPSPVVSWLQKIIRFMSKLFSKKS